MPSYQWLKDGAGGSMGEDGVIEWSESVIVDMDSVVYDVQSAIATSGFYQGQPQRLNSNLSLTDIDANVLDESNGQFWRFDLTYSTAGFSLGANTSGGTGEYRPKIIPGSWTYTEIVEEDKEDGRAIVNPVLDPYDPQPERTVAAPTLTITIRENSARMDRLEDIGKINNSSITIAGLPFPKYCAMFFNYSSEPFQDELGYWTFLNTFQIRGKFKEAKTAGKGIIGFQLEQLASGFNRRDDDAPNGKVEIKVADPEFPTDRTKDVPVATPQMLDANGDLTTTPYYEYFVVNDLTDFGKFNLPSSYPIN